LHPILQTVVFFILSQDFDLSTQTKEIDGFRTKGFAFAGGELSSGSRNQSSSFRFIVVVRPFVTSFYILYLIRL
jgi:hypothetical protein